jgi:hypothetical protein
MSELPTTSDNFRQLPTTSDNLPTTFRQPSDNLPTTFRQASDKLPTSFRQAKMTSDNGFRRNPAGQTDEIEEIGDKARGVRHPTEHFRIAEIHTIYLK